MPGCGAEGGCGPEEKPFKGWNNPSVPAFRPYPRVMREPRERTGPIPRIFDYRVLLRCIDRAEAVSRARSWEPAHSTTGTDEGDDLLFVYGNRFGCLRGGPTADDGYRACVAMPFAFGDFVCALEADARSRHDRELHLLANLWVYFAPLSGETSDRPDLLWSGRIEVLRGSRSQDTEVRSESDHGRRDFRWRRLAATLPACTPCRSDLECWIVCAAARAIECASES